MALSMVAQCELPLIRRIQTAADVLTHGQPERATRSLVTTKKMLRLSGHSQSEVAEIFNNQKLGDTFPA